MGDRNLRAGSRFGGGGIATDHQAAMHRRERLKQLAMDTIDISKDPYILRNSVGTFECKLCLTLHTTEGSYLAHTQGRRHQNKLAQRAAREKERMERKGMNRGARRKMTQKEMVKVDKIGRPAYTLTKLMDATTGNRTIEIEVSYPLISAGIQPRHRFMSAFEQKKEKPDRNFQYLLFAAIPYQTIAFKLPNIPLDSKSESFTSSWDEESKTFSLRLSFQPAADETEKETE